MIKASDYEGGRHDFERGVSFFGKSHLPTPS